MSAATIVFGATGSVGSSLCEQLQSDGRAVLAVGRDTSKLDALKEQLGVETAMATLDQPDASADGTNDGIARSLPGLSEPETKP